MKSVHMNKLLNILFVWLRPPVRRLSRIRAIPRPPEGFHYERNSLMESKINESDKEWEKH